MRTIKYIVIHCTATSQDAKIDSMVNHWRKVLGWQNNGYHYIIDKNGNHTKITELNQIANGVRNYNKSSIHIAYIGGIDSKGNPIDNRTIQQKDKLLYLCRELKRQFPNAIIKGHRDFPNVKKACPSFDAKKEYEEIFDIFG